MSEKIIIDAVLFICFIIIFFAARWMFGGNEKEIWFDCPQCRGRSTFSVFSLYNKNRKICNDCAWEEELQKNK